MAVPLLSVWQESGLPVLRVLHVGILQRHQVNAVTMVCKHCTDPPFPGPMESHENCSSTSLNIAEVVVITAVVCGVCSFTAGLLLGVLLTRCSVHCHRKQERSQTEPVYETDVLPEKGVGIELQCNEAYGSI